MPRKFKKLLDDNVTYKKVSKSPLKKIEREFNQQLQKLKRERKLEERTYKKHILLMPYHQPFGVQSNVRNLTTHLIRPIITCRNTAL